MFRASTLLLLLAAVTAGAAGMWTIQTVRDAGEAHPTTVSPSATTTHIPSLIPTSEPSPTPSPSPIATPTTAARVKPAQTQRSLSPQELARQELAKWVQCKIQGALHPVPSAEVCKNLQAQEQHILNLQRQTAEVDARIRSLDALDQALARQEKLLQLEALNAQLGSALSALSRSLVSVPAPVNLSPPNLRSGPLPTFSAPALLPYPSPSFSTVAPCRSGEVLDASGRCLKIPQSIGDLVNP